MCVNVCINLSFPRLYVSHQKLRLTTKVAKYNECFYFVLIYLDAKIRKDEEQHAGRCLTY